MSSRAFPSGYKWIYTTKIAIRCTLTGHFLTDIIGYDRLKLYVKIYTLKKVNLGYATDDQLVLDTLKTVKS